MTVRGRRWWPAVPVALALAGCSTTVSGDPTAQAIPVATTSSMPSVPSVPPVTTTTTAPVTTTKPKPKPKPTTTHAPAPRTTHRPAPPKQTTAPVHQKMVTYLITGSGSVSVRYLAGGTMHSVSGISLPWRRTVPLSGGRYAMDITTGSNANVDEQVSVDGAVVGTGHNEGAGTGSFTGTY
ncbi:hypothetical protein EV186_101193 [Labedaea rhizosphaerae]|uniref:Uncharacterized protein n=2 Tax=Labedaea rhizosphaerae TaxID=598644 RepID=A0A4R6SL09_LABRH|nr:hypothetical protein EV186_101193 [Labedaea rhizosphaerae]